jgi:hypothetical protein
MKNFKKINNLAGWSVFAVAAFTYISTIEPSASFWDCSEFISTCFKMEVGHPPGDSLFMIIGRIATFFALGDVTKVAATINIMSALASAFTILFLFWSISMIAKKIIVKTDEMTTAQLIAIMGTATIGALAYTFSDTFWFSAVEGEVYASSSLFTAAVFWAILKWENVADAPRANRWIILIAYLMGLSIGVHLLNLLAIPAIVFVYYFRKYKTTTKGIIITSLLSIGILAFVMYGIIQGYVIMASKFELLFTNGFGAPYNTGALIWIILSFALLIFGVYYSHKKGKVILNTIVLSTLVILIGYSSLMVIIIRSRADTPLNENAPDDAFSMLSYLNREQYGDRPLFYGNYFNAPVESYDEGKPTYILKDGKYVVADKQTIRNYSSQYMTVFPRMFSDPQNQDHIKGYELWTGTSDADFFNTKTDEKTGQPVKDRYGDIAYDYNSPRRSPTFGENLKFFFSYQINFMYFRYFMWNFAGRQDDIQSADGNVKNGNWISGIKFIDAMRLGNQDKITTVMKQNKARNEYYFLPLILGILGMFYMFRAGKEGKNYFWVVMLFFFFTGVAILLYLNQTPYQPRERDYAYAGSFYVFAIYIGFGVAGIYQFLIKKLKNIPQTSTAAAVSIICLGVPVLMGQQNWDDHDRSYRNTARDYGKNYLNSCAPNAILFTNGDNDTFPLWYDQEVEGVRTDVRVINLSYLNTEWYIDQMKRKAYDSDPVPFSMIHDQYDVGKRDVIYRYEDPNVYIDEKYEAHRPAFENDYKTMFENYLDFLKKSQFPEKQKKNFDYLSKGYSEFSPTQFYSFVSSIAGKKKAESVGLDAKAAEDFRADAEKLLKKISAQSMPLAALIKHIGSDNKEDKIQVENGEFVNYMPSSKFFVPAALKDIKENHVVADKDLNKVVPGIDWDIHKPYIRKNDMMVLDLLATSKWKRPVYFATTVGGDSYLNLEDYFQLEGMAFRVVPIKTDGTDRAERGRVNSDILYDNMMNKFVWGGLDQHPKQIYLDENNRRFVVNFKNGFSRLAQQLITDNQKEKAEKVLDKCTGIFTDELCPWGYYDLQAADLYYKIGNTAKGDRVISVVENNIHQDLAYYFSLNEDDLALLTDDLAQDAAVCQEIFRVLRENKQIDTEKKYLSEILDLLESRYAYKAKIGSMQKNEQEFYTWYAGLPETQKRIVALYMQILEELSKS